MMKRLLFLLFFFCWCGQATAADFDAGSGIISNQVYAGNKPLNQVIAETAGRVVTIIISQPLSAMYANLTVPADVTLAFTGDGRISCGSFTLTIQSSTANWPGQQIFASDCSSTGSVDLSASVGALRGLPQWFGGLPDDSVDDATAINALANAVGVGSRIYFSNGIWDVATAILFQNYQVFECSGLGGEALNTGTVIRTTSGGTKTIFAAKTAGSAQTYQPTIQNCGLQITSNGHTGIDLSRVLDATIANNKIRGNNTASSGQIGILIDSNPSSGLGNKIVNNTIIYTEKGIVIRQDANANLITGNKILLNTGLGVDVQGTCNGGTCTSTDSCDLVADCSSCSGTSCSSAIAGGNIGTRIIGNWIEANVTTNVHDVGKGTIISGNYFEQTTGAQSLNLWGADTIVTNNFFQQTTAKKSILLNGVSGAGGFRLNIRDNVFKGAGNAIEEVTATTTVEVGRNLYESVTNKVTTVASSGIRWVDTTEGITQATLPTNMSNGSLLFCTDCTADADCAPSGSTGGLAKRVNGAWVCN